MNRPNFILGLTLITLSSLNLYSQGDGPGDFTFRRVSFLQNKITTPSAPEAASLGKYGDYPVNAFNGLPGISIPLYSLQGAELSMPLSLTYDGGGIKVEQVPTWVGVGWTLNGGGVISRSVRGDPDMKNNYFSKASTLNQSSPTEYSNQFTENDFLYAAARKEIETQPDVFYLNAIGLGGKFFFKADKSIVMSEIRDVVITPYWNSATDDIDSFVVKDATGIIYHFAAQEKTTLTFNQDYGSESRYYYSFVYHSSWYLTRVISPNSTETIELKYHAETTPYNPHQYVNTNNFRSKTYSKGYQSGGCPDPTCPCGEYPSEYNGGPTATSIENRRFLDEIVLKKGTVAIEKLKFYSSSNSYLGGGRKLDKISLSRGSGAATEIIQQLFTYTGGTNRLTLTQLQEKNMNLTQAKEPYQFTYNSNQLPAFSSNDLDHWGFYNGANNPTSPGSLIPVINCPGINPDNSNCQGMNNPTSGANRECNEAYMKAGSLEKITYPTKGYTVFVWEANRAIAADICGSNNMERVVGGLRIKEINNYSYANVLLTSKKYYYKLADGTCSGKLFYQPEYYSSSTFTNYNYPLSEICSPQAVYRYCVNYMYYSSSKVPLGAINGGIVGYSRVEESYAGKTVYHYKNYVPGWDYEFNIQDLGQLTLKEEFNDAGQKLHSTGYKYSFDISESRRYAEIWALMVEARQEQDNKTVLCYYNGTYSWQLNGDNSYSCSQSAIYPSKFIRKPYRITQDWVYTKETYDTMFYYNGVVSAGSVKNTVTNTFGNTNVSLPTETILINSDNKVYKNLTRFTHDIGSSTMKTNLLNKNIIAIPLENEKLVDNILVYRTRMDYNSFEPTTGLPGSGAWLLPHKFYEKFSSGQSDILKMTVDRYDVSGTQVQEYHKEYDQVNTLIYSHNHSLPAARIQNGLVSEGAFSAFGTGDASQGGWTISNTSALYPDADGKTGTGYWSANGNISKTGVPAGKYLLTYWIKNQTTAAGVTGASSNSSQISSPDPGGWRFAQHILTLNSTATLTITADDPFVYLDELRLHPFDAQMATYSFNRNTKLLSGISDENSIPKKFEYDELLRLTGVRNYNNYYLKTLEYNYKTSGSTYNSVKAREVLTDAVTTVSAVNALTGANVRRKFDYFDDIGRAMQNIGVGQSASSKDVILHHDYDSYSREPNQYLPFTYTNATPGAYLSTAATEQVSFYNSQFSSEGNYAKVVTEYENSPLNRIKKVTPQGSAFNSKPITYTYGCNTQSNEVRNFRTSNAWYAANTLNKVTVKNENGDSTVTYTDLLGLKIMEARNTVKTYYLYDDRQNIVQVIQPVASESGHSSPSNIYTTTSVSNGSFVYTFDAYNRLSTKKIPSGGTTTYTYDRLDREVVRSDPNGFRFFTKYDILGRVILTGKHTTSSNPTGSEPLFETPTTTGHFYTSVAFPTSSIEVYAVNYYDDYDWEDNGSVDATYRGGYVDYPSTNYAWVKGKLTRSKNGRLNQNGTAPSAWMDDILFYDIEGKEIQKQSLQQLGYTDTSWVQYDFPGRVRKTQRSHMNNTTRTLIVERFEYDHAGRLVDTYHKINNQAEQKISNLSYNERDELLQKKLAYVGSAYGQTIDYAYNIRKWLTQINDPASCGADLFSQKLYYTDANSSLNATAKYNGNIAWMEWRTGANCLVGGVNRNKAAYGLTYDGLDRVTASKYGEYTSSWTNLDRYNETMTYDLNGNISTLVRRGYISSGNWNTIDNLTYTYDGTNTNRVSSIADGSGSTLGYPASSGSFTYDASGNQVSYGAKGISSITYNHLNLPTKYTWSGSNLEVQYDASGSKLKKIPSTGNAKTYVDNIEYSGTTIEAIYHSEGRARLISSTWEYEYAIKDHLGNARVYFKFNGSITFLQESHYYPFGMEQGGWTAPVSPENKYKYNGKEYNDDFSLGLYDYGARWYDPSVGRFTSVDKLSDHQDQLDKSPYAYAWNNPVSLNDPDGNCPFCLVAVGQFLKGAATDYVIQVAKNIDKGDGFKDALYNNVDFKQVAKSGAEDALTGGAGKVLKVTGKALGIVDKVDDVKDVSRTVNKADDVAAVSRKGAFNEAKRDAGIPRTQHPDKINGKQYDMVPMTDKNGKTILGNYGKPIMTREYQYTKPDGSKIIIQEHSAGHTQFGGDAANRHFNVRPSENTRTGKVSGTKEHYTF